MQPPFRPQHYYYIAAHAYGTGVQCNAGSCRSNGSAFFRKNIYALMCARLTPRVVPKRLFIIAIRRGTFYRYREMLRNKQPYNNYK